MRFKADAAPDHQIRHLLDRGFRDAAHVDQATGAKYRAAIRDLLDLPYLVRDQYDGLAVVPQIIDDFEQRLDLLGREHGGGLVEDHDLGPAVQHLQNLHALAGGDGQVLDAIRRVDRQPVFLGQRVDLLIGLRHVHPGQQPETPLHRFLAEHDVFRHGVVFHQRKVLVHHADAQCGGIVGGMKDHGPAVDQYLPAVRLVHAEEHAHQGGLARAVLPEQGVDLALANGDGDVVVCRDAREVLRDMAHFNDVITHIQIISLETKGLSAGGAGRPFQDMAVSSGPGNRWARTGCRMAARSGRPSSIQSIQPVC